MKLLRKGVVGRYTAYRLHIKIPILEGTNRVGWLGRAPRGWSAHARAATPNRRVPAAQCRHLTQQRSSSTPNDTRCCSLETDGELIVKQCGDDWFDSIRGLESITNKCPVMRSTPYDKMAGQTPQPRSPWNGYPGVMNTNRWKGVTCSHEERISPQALKAEENLMREFMGSHERIKSRRQKGRAWYQQPTRGKQPLFQPPLSATCGPLASRSPCLLDAFWAGPGLGTRHTTTRFSLNYHVRDATSCLSLPFDSPPFDPSSKRFSQMSLPDWESPARKSYQWHQVMG